MSSHAHNYKLCHDWTYVDAESCEFAYTVVGPMLVAQLREQIMNLSDQGLPHFEERIWRCELLNLIELIEHDSR